MSASVVNINPEEFQYEKLKISVKNCLSTKEVDKTLDKLTSIFKELENVGESEKKTSIDQAFKDYLHDMVIKERSTDELAKLLELSIEAVKNDVCTAGLPFVMLTDLFDTVTHDNCDKLFTFLENRVETWKTDLFYNAGKNYLLRMCNDLLRRLSRSQHTIFCGRIQLFLARLFPLTEKSGLNLMSQFNLENVTIFTTKSEDYESARKMADMQKEEQTDMEEGEMEDSSGTIPIDYNLYKRFWSLQDYFRRPQQCYDKTSWEVFSQNAKEVLDCFGSYKLDDVKSSKKKLDASRQQKTNVFFAKYLTSEKLLDLQLSDGNFRRYVLVQFLILFQYLNAPVKFKSPNYSLNEDQSTLLKDYHSKVMNLLKETPPDGEKFAAAIEHILSREENWNSWKNEGCPVYMREAQTDLPELPPRPRKRTLGEDVKYYKGKVKKLGNPELSRLWNLTPDNMAACKDEKGDTMPKLEVFFEEALEQMDPDAQVEDEYKLINNPSFAWKALRVMARKHSQFFTSQPAPPGPAGTIRSQTDYLDLMLQKMAKEKGPSASSSIAEGDSEKADIDEEDSEKLGSLSTSANEKPTSLSTSANEKSTPTTSSTGPSHEKEKDLNKAQLEKIADKLAGQWKKLATEFKFDEDVISYVDSEKMEESKKAFKFLTLWQENEGPKATLPVLVTAMKKVGLTNILKQVFSTKQ